MNWIDFISNPQQITKIYSTIPDLDQVQVSEIELGNRLDLRIKFILWDLPDRIPSRWRIKRSSAVEIALDFWEIKDFLLIVNEITQLFTFSFSSAEQGWIRFVGESNDGKIMFFCRSMYIQRVNPI